LLALLGAHPILHVSRIRVKWEIKTKLPEQNDLPSKLPSADGKKAQRRGRV